MKSLMGWQMGVVIRVNIHFPMTIAQGAKGEKNEQGRGGRVDKKDLCIPHFRKSSMAKRADY